MKQLKTVLFSIALLYGFLAVSQTIVSTDVEKKNPVVFDFTGIHCVSCPKAHEAIAVAKNHYPQVVALAFHTGDFAVPGPGEPDFRTIAGDSIVNNYAFWKPDAGQYRVVWSYPTVCVDGNGVENGVGTDTTQFLDKISEVVTQDAIVNIGALATIDTVKRKLKVQIECYYTSAAQDSNYLTVSITQNGLKSTQAGAGDDYEHKEMFRMFVSNVWGDTLGIPDEGDLIEKTYYIDLPDSIKYYNGNAIELTLKNIQVQAFISSNDTTVIAYDFIGVPYKNRIAFDIQNGVNAGIKYANINGIFTTGNEPGFEIYPNPASDYINIRLSRQMMNEQPVLQIFDINGRELKKPTLSNIIGNKTFRIPVKGLEKGIYFIRLESKNLLETKKFVLE